MSTHPTINITNDITLITLQNCPSESSFMAKIFNKITEYNINVDMISLAPNQGGYTSISFTISDDDLGKILNFTSNLHESYKIKTIVSSGNCKISVYDLSMKDSPGVAAKVFSAIAKVDTDIRIMTTSEMDISLLVTASDFHQTLNEIENILK